LARHLDPRRTPNYHHIALHSSDEQDAVVFNRSA
jgi:hypothetical protein